MCSFMHNRSTITLTETLKQRTDLQPVSILQQLVNKNGTRGEQSSLQQASSVALLIRVKGY